MVLDDEADETSPLRFFIDQLSRGITILSLDEATGDLTFSACESGFVGYASTRAGTVYSAYAFLTVTATGSCTAPGGSAGGPVTGSTGATATSPVSTTAASVATVVTTGVLPDTGAVSALRGLLLAGLLLVVAGLVLVGLAPRRRAVLEG